MIAVNNLAWEVFKKIGRLWSQKLKPQYVGFVTIILA